MATTADFKNGLVLKVDGKLQQLSELPYRDGLRNNICHPTEGNWASTSCVIGFRGSTARGQGGACCQDQARRL